MLWWLLQKYVLTISAGWGCGTLVGFQNDTDSALGSTRTKICFSVRLHIDSSGKIMCWLWRWISLVKEMIVCNFILTNSKVLDPLQLFSYWHDEIPVSEPDIHCSDLRSIDVHLVCLHLITLAILSKEYKYCFCYVVPRVDLQWKLLDLFGLVCLDAKSTFYLHHVCMFVHMSVCPVNLYEHGSHWIYFHANLILGDFYENLSRKSRFGYKCAKMSGALREDLNMIFCGWWL